MGTLSPRHRIFRTLVAGWLLFAVSPSVFADSTTFVSDDFNAFNLNRTLWQVVDPLADAGFTMTDTETDAASVAITVAGKVPHDIWIDGYESPRIMQPATNTDFMLEAKFLTGIVGDGLRSFQAHGVVVEQDLDNIIRFDVYTGTDGTTKVFAAIFAGGFASPDVRVDRSIGPQGTSPLWIRVERSGDSWTQLYSQNGVTWDTAVTFTHALSVTQVGTFAGNAGYNPDSFTSKIDYFFNPDSIAYPDDSQPAPPDTIGPYIHNIQITELTLNGVEVSWNTDEPATGTLEYGLTTGYGSSVNSVGTSTEHSVVITGLLSNQTYNYRILGTDLSANPDSTGNKTVKMDRFDPEQSARSDDFGGTALDTSIWTVVNPLGDGTVTVDSGMVRIAVPAGTPHDIWIGGAQAPRIMQEIEESNSWEFDAKFMTGVQGTASSFQLQGVLVEEDLNNVMRFDFVNGPSGTKAFAAVLRDGFDNPSIRINVNILPFGTAPLYLRVKRYGALWSMFYSIDGISWVEAGNFWEFLEPARVGLFAGNAGISSPAFEARIEYFLGVLPARPILLAPANGDTTIDMSTTLTWAAATQATSYDLQLATDSAFTQVVVQELNYAQTTRQVLGLLYDTQYFWRVTSKNATGVSAVSPAFTFTTISAAPATPSLLSPSDAATGVATTPLLVWSSSERATSYRVQVATDTLFGAGLIVDDPTLVDTSKSITGLVPGTTYFWRANASSSGGTSAFTPVWSFTTLVGLPGQVSLLAPTDEATTRSDTVAFLWNSATPSVSRYWFEISPDSLFLQFVVTDTNLTDTATVLTNLVPNTTFFWRVKARNSAGWGSFSEIRRFTALTTGVSDSRGVPTRLALAQNFPNPFNPTTAIEFALPEATNVRLEIYNAIGERVATLIDGPMPAGYHLKTFSAAELPSGLYLYRLSTPTGSFVRKMMLVK